MDDVLLVQFYKSLDVFEGVWVSELILGDNLLLIRTVAVMGIDHCHNELSALLESLSFRIFQETQVGLLKDFYIVLSANFQEFLHLEPRQTLSITYLLTKELHTHSIKICLS